MPISTTRYNNDVDIEPMDMDLESMEVEVEMNPDNPNFDVATIQNDTSCAIKVIFTIKTFRPWSQDVFPGDSVNVPIVYNFQDKSEYGVVEVIYGREGQTYENLDTGETYRVSAMISVHPAGG